MSSAQHILPLIMQRHADEITNRIILAVSDANNTLPEGTKFPNDEIALCWYAAQVYSQWLKNNPNMWVIQFFMQKQGFTTKEEATKFIRDKVVLASGCIREENNTWVVDKELADRLVIAVLAWFIEL